MPKIYRKSCDGCGEYYESWNKRFCRKCVGKEKIEDGYKWCSGCGQVKAHSEFNKWKVSKDGLRNWCQECQRGASNTYYKLKTEKETHHFAYKSIRTRFRTDQDISYDTFMEWYKKTPKICYYCGIPEEIFEHLAKTRGYGKRGYKRLQVDRKNNFHGYQKENICLACPTCNTSKNNIFTEHEMLEISHKYIKPKWQKELTETRKVSP